MHLRVNFRSIIFSFGTVPSHIIQHSHSANEESVSNVSKIYCDILQQSKITEWSELIA